MADKAALISQLDAHRKGLAARAARVRRSADIAGRLQASVARNRYVWFGGAALLGLALVQIRPRKAPVRVDRAAGEKIASTGLLLAAAKIVFDLARPALIRWAGSRVTGYLSRPRSKPR